MDSLGRIVNILITGFLWFLSIISGLDGLTIYGAAETILQQQLGALWIIVAAVFLSGGCIVFSRQCVSGR